MTPEQNRSRRYKRVLAIAGATLVAAGGTIGLAFGAGSDDGQPVTPPATAPLSPTPTGTHWPSPPQPEQGGTTRPDGGPDEGTRGLHEGSDTSDTSCVDPKSTGNGPQHC